MSKEKYIAVFSENPDLKSLYLQFGSSGDFEIRFLEKNDESLDKLGDDRPAGVIFEIPQPAMSEIEYFDELSDEYNDLPVIIVSAFFYDTKDIIFGDRICDFILRPLTIEKLKSSVSEHFDEGETKPEKSAEKKTEKTTEPQSEDFSKVVKSNKKLSVLLELSKWLTSIKDLDELLSKIMYHSADILNAERATLFVVDRENDELWSRSGIGLETKEIRIPIDTGIAGETVSLGRAQVIDDPYSHQKFNKEVDKKTGFKTRNILCLPMRNIEGNIIGVIQVLNKKEGSFDENDESFMHAMAANTSIVLENALLHEEQKKQFEEVKQAYEELYVAQNQILKEARVSTISEIMGYVTEQVSKQSAEPVAKKLRTMTEDETVVNLLDEITARHKELVRNINNYVSELRQRK